SNIKISIIFPSYNGENVIGEMLKSVEDLTNLNEIEIVIIDNNSKDSTREIIKSFNNININLIKQSNNLGFARACNIGVRNANGEFIFITNQDVAFPKDFFKILLNKYNILKKDKEIILCPAIVFFNKYINYFGAKIHFLGFSYTPNMYQKIPEKKMTFKTQKASGCSMFMKKSTFLKLNGFDPYFFMYHEDTDFSLKALRNNYVS
ncbi:MAG: glycosyltransferase family 2 protein, partial [Promethearchaeota archaeon]